MCSPARTARAPSRSRAAAHHRAAEVVHAQVHHRVAKLVHQDRLILVARVVLDRQQLLLAARRAHRPAGPRVVLSGVARRFGGRRGGGGRGGGGGERRPGVGRRARAATLNDAGLAQAVAVEALPAACAGRCGGGGGGGGGGRPLVAHQRPRAVPGCRLPLLAAMTDTVQLAASRSARVSRRAVPQTSARIFAAASTVSALTTAAAGRARAARRRRRLAVGKIPPEWARRRTRSRRFAAPSPASRRARWTYRSRCRSAASGGQQSLAEICSLACRGRTARARTSTSAT